MSCLLHICNTLKIPEKFRAILLQVLKTLCILHVHVYIERPTEYAEQDVYLTESRYHEADKEIKKAKQLKVRDWEQVALRPVNMYIAVQVMDFALFVSILSCLSPASWTRCTTSLRN